MRTAEIFKPMEPKAKRRWLRALRSGKYRRGTGRLMIPKGLIIDDVRAGSDKHCCLGVLEQCITGKVKSPENGCLSRDFSKQVGLSTKVQDHLAYMNDGDTFWGYKGHRGWSFKRIANWIEKHL